MVWQFEDVPMQPVIILLFLGDIDNFRQHIMRHVRCEQHVGVIATLFKPHLKHQSVTVAILNSVPVSPRSVRRMNKNFNFVIV